MWKANGTRIVKTILKKKNKIGSFMASNFNIYYKAKVIKTEWYQQRDKYISQWNKIEPKNRGTQM